MVYDVLTYRQDLLNHPAPSVTPVTEVPVYIYPKDSAINVPHDWVAFDWDPVADADFYNLQVTYTITFASTPMIDVNVEGTAYTASLLPDKTYRWRVIPVKSGNTCVPEVPLYTFTTVMGTGIDAFDHSASDLTIYPTLNYTNSSFHFTFNSTAYALSQIHFISMDGRVVKQEPVTIVPGDNSWEIPVAGLSPGMYIVRMVNDGKVFQGKVVIGE